MVGLFVFMPLMIIAAGTSLLFMPAVVYWNRRKRRRLSDDMARQNRTLPWPDFQCALEEKCGTLIVEGDPFKGPNFWWTPEDLRRLSPHPCSENFGSLSGKTYRPFMRWCHERYTSPASGSASLVLGGEGQRWGFALGSEEDERATGIFEDMPTVLITNRFR
jgi:hypothetical protein